MYKRKTLMTSVTSAMIQKKQQSKMLAISFHSSVISFDCSLAETILIASIISSLVTSSSPRPAIARMGLWSSAMALARLKIFVDIYAWKYCCGKKCTCSYFSAFFPQLSACPVCYRTQEARGGQRPRNVSSRESGSQRSNCRFHISRVGYKRTRKRKRRWWH